MTTKVVDYFIENDFTAAYAVLVWIGVMLAVAWIKTMGDDPANKGLPEWDRRLRRVGIIIMLVGFLLSVLFGGDQKWAPWPTHIIIALGFDFYLAAALLTARHRAKIAEQVRERLGWSVDAANLTRN